eukprot:905920-Rhodomonas_salina.2
MCIRDSSQAGQSATLSRYFSKAGQSNPALHAPATRLLRTFDFALADSAVQSNREGGCIPHPAGGSGYPESTKRYVTTGHPIAAA